MKKLTWKILLSLCIIWLTALDATAQKLTNQGFENYCGTDVYGAVPSVSCPTFGLNCVPGWYRSHGTPQIYYGAAAEGNNYSAMWGIREIKNNTDVRRGEGIFANYTFLFGKSYRICLWVRNNENWGDLVVKATNGLVALTDNQGHCGDPIPPVASETMFDQPMTWKNVWTKLTIIYTPSANYSQLWIYPRGTVLNQTVWLNVDDIDVRANCFGDITFDMNNNTLGGLVTPFNYANFNNIFAGSNTAGGSVINSTAGNVLFEAAEKVVLTHKFSAVTSANRYFIARTYKCDNSQCIPGTIDITVGISGDEGEPFVPGGEEVEMQGGNTGSGYDEIAVYPNPTNGSLRFSGMGSGEYSYKFTSITGQVLLHGTITGGNVLDIATYPPGFYFIEITDAATKTISFHKIIKE